MRLNVPLSCVTSCPGSKAFLLSGLGPAGFLFGAAFFFATFFFFGAGAFFFGAAFFFAAFFFFAAIFDLPNLRPSICSGADAVNASRALFCYGRPMLSIDLTGKRAFVAGVSDDNGFGFAIAKALAEAGASICVGTWPPTLGIFENLIERGKMAESLKLQRGGSMTFEKIYPLDAAYDRMEEVPPEIRENKRYRERGD